MSVLGVVKCCLVSFGCTVVDSLWLYPAGERTDALFTLSYVVFLVEKLYAFSETRNLLRQAKSSKTVLTTT